VFCVYVCLAGAVAQSFLSTCLNPQGTPKTSVGRKTESAAGEVLSVVFPLVVRQLAGDAAALERFFLALLGDGEEGSDKREGEEGDGDGVWGL